MINPTSPISQRGLFIFHYFVAENYCALSGLGRSDGGFPPPAGAGGYSYYATSWLNMMY
jgi:hypothetical protein